MLMQPTYQLGSKEKKKGAKYIICQKTESNLEKMKQGREREVPEREEQVYCGP